MTFHGLLWGSHRVPSSGRKVAFKFVERSFLRELYRSQVVFPNTEDESQSEVVAFPNFTGRMSFLEGPQVGSRLLKAQRSQVVFDPAGASFITSFAVWVCSLLLNFTVFGFCWRVVSSITHKLSQFSYFSSRCIPLKCTSSSTSGRHATANFGDQF